MLRRGRVSCTTTRTFISLRKEHQYYTWTASVFDESSEDRSSQPPDARRKVHLLALSYALAGNLSTERSRWTKLRTVRTSSNRKTEVVVDGLAHKSSTVA